MGIDGRVPTARELYFQGCSGDVETQNHLERSFFGSIRQKNGTYKYTRSRRLDEINELVADLFPPHRPLHIMDVAVSSGITTLEWSWMLEHRGIAHHITAGDVNLDAYLVTALPGLHALIDRTGYPLQYEILGHALMNPPTWWQRTLFFPILIPLKACLRMAFNPARKTGLEGGWPACRPIKLVTPRLFGNEQIELVEDDIITNESFNKCYHVLRAANILNKSYFDETTLIKILTNLRNRLVTGGILVVSSTTGDLGCDEPSLISNDGTIFVLQDSGQFEVLARIGSGSAVEQLALGLVS